MRDLVVIISIVELELHPNFSQRENNENYLEKFRADQNYILSRNFSRQNRF